MSSGFGGLLADGHALPPSDGIYVTGEYAFALLTMSHEFNTISDSLRRRMYRSLKAHVRAVWETTFVRVDTLTLSAQDRFSKVIGRERLPNLRAQRRLSVHLYQRIRGQQIKAERESQGLPPMDQRDVFRQVMKEWKYMNESQRTRWLATNAREDALRVAQDTLTRSFYENNIPACDRNFTQGRQYFISNVIARMKKSSKLNRFRTEEDLVQYAIKQWDDKSREFKREAQETAIQNAQLRAITAGTGRGVARGGAGTSSQSTGRGSKHSRRATVQAASPSGSEGEDDYIDEDNIPPNFMSSSSDDEEEQDVEEEIAPKKKRVKFTDKSASKGGGQGRTTPATASRAPRGKDPVPLDDNDDRMDAREKEKEEELEEEEEDEDDIDGY